MYRLIRGMALGAAACLTATAGTSAKGKAARVKPSRQFEFRYVIRVPATQGRELRLWAPLPHSNRYQTITRMRIESPVAFRLERAASGNEDVYLRLTGAQLRRPSEIHLRFDVLRRERTIRLPKNGPVAAGDPPPASLAPYLQPERMIPLNGVIAQLSAQTTAGVSDPLEKARRIYEYVIAHMRYDKSGTGWGRGDAVWACSSHRGNCTDFHSLFIGMARAAGIPARFTIGFPLPPDQAQGTIPGYHCWAEFYLPGTGWVPIDASEAWQDPARHDFYFGALDPDRVAFTMGRDLRLSPPQQGAPLNYFVYPYAELDGRAFDGLQHRLSFRDLKR